MLLDIETIGFFDYLLYIKIELEYIIVINLVNLI